MSNKCLDTKSFDTFKNYDKDFFDVSDFVLCPDGTPGTIKVLMKDLALVKKNKDNKEESYKLDSLKRIVEDNQYIRDQLNPVLFLDDTLRSDIREKLKETADLFIEEVEKEEFKLDILDIVLVGSNSSYNYTELSDIDLHIIYNSSVFDEQTKYFVSKYFDSFRSLFNLTHKIFIKNCKVEVYLEDSENRGIYNGIYSILKNKWIQFPVKDKVTIDTGSVDTKFEDYKNNIINLTSLPGQYKDSLTLYKNIFRLRRNSLQVGGEFCTENLAFKKLRNEGFIDTLRDYIRSEKDKDLSIESLSESFRLAILGDLT